MGIEFESKDEQRVSQVLASLSHVEPPGDFDVRVRSRIATGKPSTPRSWIWPVFAGAAPLLFLVAVGAYFITRPESTVPSGIASAPSIEQEKPSFDPANYEPEVATGNTTDTSNAEKMIVKPPDVDNKMVVPTDQPRGPNIGGGSYEDTVDVKKTITPRGINVNPRMMPKPRDFDTPTVIPIKDVLTQIGVDSQGTSTGMKVVSVTVNGAANRLGLKANDVIESIDDKPVNEKTSYKGKFAGKKMRVIREGKPIEIDLSKP